jgi:hypothetical protein
VKHRDGEKDLKELHGKKGRKEEEKKEQGEEKREGKKAGKRRIRTRKMWGETKRFGG